MLNKPAWAATATDRPVKIKGVVFTSVSARAYLLPNAPVKISPKAISGL
jgi:hypothetical protein